MFSTVLCSPGSLFWCSTVHLLCATPQIAYAWSHRRDLARAPGGPQPDHSSSAANVIELADAKGGSEGSAGAEKAAASNKGQAPSFVRTVSLMKPGFDGVAMDKLQKQIAIWSGICLFINALIIIVGFAAVKRTLGPFAVSNIFTLVLAFACV